MSWFSADVSYLVLPVLLQLAAAHVTSKRLLPNFNKQESFCRSIQIALMLLREVKHGTQSSWHVWIHSLPQHFDTLMHWSQQELDQLQMSSTPAEQEYLTQVSSWLLCCALACITDDAGKWCIAVMSSAGVRIVPQTGHTTFHLPVQVQT